MAQASIPVDLFNPGQVFASLGFLEAAEVLLGNAQGGFNWADEPETRFELCAGGTENPFRVVLEFVAYAELQRLAPPGYADTSSSAGAKNAVEIRLCRVSTFPGREADSKTLPIRLARNGRRLDITHLCDGSSRNPFKLFAGQQNSADIVQQMKSAIRQLWNEEQEKEKMFRDPFGVIVPLGGSSFKFDARKAWTGIDAGYSPDDQGHGVEASPVVELLGAIGLEHARPDEFEPQEVRYGVWKGPVRPVLARAAFGGIYVGVPLRIFRFTLKKAGQNKVVTFAQEEVAI